MSADDAHPRILYKPPSGISDWDGWPTDVVDELRSLNKAERLTFLPLTVSGRPELRWCHGCHQWFVPMNGAGRRADVRRLRGRGGEVLRVDGGGGVAVSYPRPIGDRVLVQPVSGEEETPSGIVIPEPMSPSGGGAHSRQHPTLRGVVTHVGTGSRAQEELGVGDVVLFCGSCSLSVKIAGADLRLMDLETVMVVLEGADE